MAIVDDAADPVGATQARQVADQSAVIVWTAVIAFTLVCLALAGPLPWLAKYPDAWVLPITGWLNAAMSWFVDHARSFFRAIAWLLDHPMTWVRNLLHWLPWPVLVVVTGLVSHRAGGWKLAAFAILSLLYMLVIGYWDESMNSLALIAISVPMAVAIGFLFGIWGYRSPGAERGIMAVLDVLQTVPAFAYLLPILMLFGFGPVVGLIASVLYSFAPMVRNTIVGLREVPSDVIEAGEMSGATPMQLFFKVRLPMAQRQILLGVNQTTMASLSMVIIASIIGGTSDIGWEVLSTMRKALFGESLLAGIVIALMAMILDRITWGLAVRAGGEEGGKSWFDRYRYWVIGVCGVIAALVLSQVVPLLATYPNNLVVYPAQPLNDAISWFVVNFKGLIDVVKTSFLFFFMLPLRIGLDQAVSPFTWGFQPSLAHAVFYVTGVATLGWWLLKRVGVAAAVAAVLFGIIFFAGLAEMPWPAMAALLVVFAWRLGGTELAIGTAGAVAFLLLSGSWEKAMLSLYLCGIAVFISFFGGTAVGIWAAHNEHVSGFMRPINDTLQTMPLFVILIPIVMIFKIGDFTALLAIIAYAYVPAFRYAENGIRTVSPEVVEAATALGCTRWQLLTQVKLPLAMPNIMLGLNQTIMYGIAMLVIAALVGTNELGQQVYIGLGDGDFGVGMVAGIGMAIIAITADRMCQAWKEKYEATIA